MVIGYLNGKTIRFYGGVNLCNIEIGKDLYGRKVLSTKELIDGSDGFIASQGDTCRFFEITVQDKDTMEIKQWYYFCYR